VGAPHRRERVFLLARRVADADGQGQRQPRGVVVEERGRARYGGSGMLLAKPAGVGLQGPWHQPNGAGIGAPVGGGAGGGAGDADRARLEGTAAVGAGGPAGESGPAVARVGRDANGAAGWLDATRWPAGRGPEQYGWEPARTVPPRSDPDRGRRVKSLGNAVVPQCAYIVGRRLLELESGTARAMVVQREGGGT
jgi:hypothetical protein